MNQLLFADLQEKTINDFPSTRYQGSKYKILHWIWENLKDLKFNSALDAFGGSGAVSYLFKTKDKKVIYNDILKFNHVIGSALIENDSAVLSDEDIDFVIKPQKNCSYPSFIKDNFEGIYFTGEENSWLDKAIASIQEINNKHKRAMAYFTLFQACIVKRPFNLFHRKNLYIRTADVERSFGNKVTWDKPFDACFRQFSREANNAVFENGHQNESFCKDIFELEVQPDLVYIDTPYINSNGIGVDYLDFYHFLEGLCDYPNWKKQIDWESKHKKFQKRPSVWFDKNKITDGFDRLFRKFSESILVISYRGDGIPSIEKLTALLRRYKKRVHMESQIKYKYVLSKTESREVLIIGQ